MKKKIKSLVIGLGNIGLNYDLRKSKEISTHCKAINQSSKYELIGGVDKNLNNIKKFKSIYKKPCFASIEKALVKLDPELVVISSNTKSHFKVFKIIKKIKNLRYIILEKPGTDNIKHLISIFSYLEKKNIKIFINYFRLFDNYYLNIAKKIKKNKNLEIFIFYNRGILNNCSHFISFLNLFVKNLKKIKILKTYKKNKYDYEADFQIVYQNAKINFFRNNIKELLNLKIIINGEKGSWTSIKNFNEFTFSKVNDDFFLKQKKNYMISKLLQNKNIMIPQFVVYDKIQKYRKQDEIFNKKNSIETFNILKKIILKVQLFNKKKG